MRQAECLQFDAVSCIFWVFPEEVESAVFIKVCGSALKGMGASS